MARLTREDFEAAVLDALSRAGGQMDYDALTADLAASGYTSHLKFLPYMKQQGQIRQQVVAGLDDNGQIVNRHVVMLV